ncbi:hypothetical protein EB118_16915 [bacterium]|nr:hypothetical protein [Pseudomonadota bacterium]NDD04739.1 hypothetical protein [Pseudomonadota bacterium]NDG31737.1 hypothetical protein [bacterium]
MAAESLLGLNYNLGSFTNPYAATPAATTGLQSLMTGTVNPITAGIGGALGLAQGLFGTASRQTTRSRTEFTPEDIQAIRTAQSTYQGMVPGLLTDLQARQKAVLEGIQAPQTGFQFAQTPDAMTRAIAAAATQGLTEQAATQRANLARQFRGQPGAARALMAQADMQTRLQQNPLLFQAFQQQQGRELAQAQQQMAQQQAANEAIMAREQMAANLALMGPQQQAALLNTLFQLGQGFGTQVQETKSRGGGLFG